MHKHGREKHETDTLSKDDGNYRYRVNLLHFDLRFR